MAGKKINLADLVFKVSDDGTLKVFAGSAKKAGKELGQKVTTRKLNKAWTKAGEPTDIGSITNILSAQGLSDEQIGTVAKDTGQPLKKDPTNELTLRVRLDY